MIDVNEYIEYEYVNEYIELRFFLWTTRNKQKWPNLVFWNSKAMK